MNPWESYFSATVVFVTIAVVTLAIVLLLGFRAKRPKEPLIFLSHSGLDAEFATDFSKQVRNALRSHAISVKVFNTSEPQFRFAQLAEQVPAEQEYKQTLFDYLERNIRASSIYLLLISPNAVATNSEWITFEMQTALEITTNERSLHFFPLATDQTVVDQIFTLSPNYRRYTILSLYSPDAFNFLISELVQMLNARRTK